MSHLKEILRLLEKIKLKTVRFEIELCKATQFHASDALIFSEEDAKTFKLLQISAFSLEVPVIPYILAHFGKIHHSSFKIGTR